MKASSFTFTNILLFFIATFIFTSCEEEFTPDVSTEDPQIVVEGYVEAGAQALPPYVVLTTSVPFFADINTSGFNDFFVHDADIKIDNGDTEVTLTEICLNSLADEQKEQFAILFGFNPDSLTINFCVYFQLENIVGTGMLGEIGKTYDLTVKVDNKTITASTTIPTYVPLDSIDFQIPVGEISDTLRELLCYINDPGSIESYFRYFTSTQNIPLIPPFNSVFDDAFFNGQQFEFPLQKAEPSGTSFDPETFGFFAVGDTATLKWTTIDEAHYKFWSTLEFSRANQGPFSSYTRVATNINGGLGIWGGYASGYYNKIVK